MVKTNSRTGRNSFIYILFLTLVGPLVFILVFETILRIVPLDVDAVKDKNVKIALPVWLVADEKWVDFNLDTLKKEEGIPADTISWLLHFEEARYFLYKMKPRVEATIVNYFNPIEREQGMGFKVTSNSRGFRTGEFTEKKGKDVFRVVALGDSSTFGWGVDPQYVFSTVLEHRLNEFATGRKCEVINLGMPGYSSQHGVAIFKHIVSGLGPDVVIVSFGANDPRFIHHSLKDLIEREETAIGAIRSFLRYFKTYKFMRKMVLKIYDPLKPGNLEKRDLSTRESHRTVPLTDFRQNLEFLVHASRQLGAEVIFLSVCTPRLYIETVQRVAQQEHVPFINVQELMFSHFEQVASKKIYRAMTEHYERLYGADKMQARQSLYLTVDGCHPNMIGHSLLAEALFEHIVASHLIPAVSDGQ